ncbi:SAM-dependent methyltransferase [Paenibacillus shirakamiensis]|uniref:SAM-dependent methyltransferase n=1 Tax=Paenibacillus shirakamiensis TaxID=1265935 RepID=A0ABS4JF54_9BACL|nr:SAM-dependent methyltransferase [Paenibacillus shirakamiensis]
MMRLDLGCGSIKHEGCIGIDILPYPEVDVVQDFNLPLPYADQSVDFVMASNSLQYSDNLQQMMQELYRICRHGSTVCIVAPYAHVAAHLVNPHFRQLFNEHSPRYWTTHNEFYVDPEEYRLSEQEGWSLITSEDPSSPAEIDFRLLRVEFFYLPQYEGLYEDVELSLLRQSQMNVAFQVMFHLLVVKEDILDEEIRSRSAQPQEEPKYIEHHRFKTSKLEASDPLYYIDHISSLQTAPLQVQSPAPSLPETVDKQSLKVQTRTVTSKRRSPTSKTKKPTSLRKQVKKHISSTNRPAIKTAPLTRKNKARVR